MRQRWWICRLAVIRFSYTYPLAYSHLPCGSGARTLDAFRVFDIIYIMTQGGPANATKVISFLTYQEAFKFLNFGKGAALAYIITMFVALIALVYTRLMQRQVEY